MSDTPLRVPHSSEAGTREYFIVLAWNGNSRLNQSAGLQLHSGYVHAETPEKAAAHFKEILGLDTDHPARYCATSGSAAFFRQGEI